MTNTQPKMTDIQPIHIRKALEDPPSAGSPIYVQDVTASITYKAATAKGIHISEQDFNKIKGTRTIYNAKEFWDECLALEDRKEMDIEQTQKVIKALDNPPTTTH